MRVKKAGIREIAEQAGVAMSTVSHVLNGTASISEEVRARVLEIASEVGYLARRQAKAAIATITQVMVAVPEEALPENDVNLVTWTILSALTQECRVRGVQMVPFSLSARLSPAQLVDEVRASGVDGLILLNDDRPELLSAISACGIPTVLINGEDPSMLVDSVTPGNRFAAQHATSWLLDRGFDRVLHLTWAGRKTVRRRRDGFVEAMAEAGKSGNSVLVAEGFEPQHGEARIRRWLDEDGMPTGPIAIFCAADNLAFGAIKALNAAGLRVPDDVSVMGFDGIALGEFHAPSLTTISIPLPQFASEALSLLQQRLVSRDAPRAARRVELGCDLIERQSVGRPRSDFSYKI